MPEDLLPREAAKRAVLLEADKGFERHLNELGMKVAVKDKDGKVVGQEYVRSWDEAQRIADEINDAQGLDLVPVNIDALRKGGRRLQEAKERMDLSVAEERLLEDFSDRIAEAFKAPPDGRGRFALIPEQAMRRIVEHNRPTGTGLKAIQSVTNVWKQVILTTSKGWIPGNIIDLTMRSAIEGITPFDWKRGQRLMKLWRKQDPEGASIFEERALGGGIFRTTEKTSNYRRAEQFEGSAIEGTAKALSRLGKRWGPRQAINVFREYAKAIFYGNGKLELHYRYAALGKHAKREIRQNLDDQAGWLRFSDDALKDFIHRGLTATPDQVKAAKAVERVYGRWSKQGPDARKFTATAGPFIQWLRVATKYVFVTLPAHHPIKVGILAALTEMSETERKQLGLTLFPEKGQETAWHPLQGGIPTGDGRILAFQSKQSFGIVSDFPASFAGFITPQWQEALDMWRFGTDWTGNKVRHEDGTELNPLERTLLGVAFVGESFLPGAYYARSLSEGKKPKRVFNPFFVGEAASNKKGSGVPGRIPPPDETGVDSSVRIPPPDETGVDSSIKIPAPR